jgi:hypothetical protein
LQRLPTRSIERSDVLHKVIFHEDPSPPDFSPGDGPRFGALSKLFRIDVKQVCRFLQIKGAHGKASNVCSVARRDAIDVEGAESRNPNSISGAGKAR